MSKLEFELDCSVRTDLGKGASRRLRRLEGNIPAVIYGGEKDPISLTIPHKDIYKAIQNEAFFAHIITLKIGKKKEKAVIKALQRHPAKDLVLHADFLRVNEKEAIQVRVPLHFINEEKCAGVKVGGGNIMKTLNEIEVTCLPKDLPEYIEVDMLNVELGANVHLSDIVLPEGVTSVSLASHNEDNDLNVAAVHAPKGAADDDTKESADGAADSSGASQD